MVKDTGIAPERMALNEADISKQLGLRRVLIPIIIGLGVTAWLLVSSLSEVRFVPDTSEAATFVWSDGNGNGAVDRNDATDFRPIAPDEPGATEKYRQTTAFKELSNIDWTWYSTLWMLIALLMVAVRDLGYMYRIRVLTDKQLSWRQSFDVIMLWEFASSITPSVVGGSGVALFILNREGIPLGRSTAVVMVTAMMDELFYILTVPVVLLIVGTQSLFVLEGDRSFFGMELNTEAIFWMGYGFLAMLTIIIVAGVLLWPRRVKRLLFLLFKLPFLKRWQRRALQTGNELVVSSDELKTKPFSFWLKSFGATFFSWTARFWIVNFMILAFTSTSLFENFMIYARQLVMWVIMLISPTPGSAGVAEVAFQGFLSDFLPVALPAIVLATIWRLASYYPYLIMGVVVLPRWLKRTAREKKERENAAA